MSKQTDFSFIRYSNCWEDTNILLDALEINEHKIGLSIASAGDNTLAMLAHDPEKIYAFDLNKTQLYCLELKIASIRNYNRAKTLKLLGVIDCKNRQELYRNISNQLTPEARAYFDINPDIINNGIIHIGKFDHFLRMFGKSIVPIICKKTDFQKFARLDDTKEQEKFYDEKIRTRRYRALFKIYFGAKVMGKFGRDKNFYKYVDKNDKKESGNDIEARVRYGVTHSINKTNPYLNYIAFGNYTDESLPYYLKRENYYKIKANLNKIELIYGDLLAINNLSFDFFNLSDIFEYMSEKDFRRNIHQLNKLANKGAIIAYWNQQNKRYIKNHRFVFDQEKSQKLFSENQSWFYRDFCVFKKISNR